MAFYEKRAVRNGIPVPIECIYMTANAERPLNYHYHDYAELLFGISGEASIYIGGTRYTLGKSDMIVINSNTPHFATGNGALSEYIVVKFLPSVLFFSEQTYFEYLYASLFTGQNDTAKAHFLAKELEGTGVSELFFDMMREWQEQRFGYELGIRGGVLSVVMFVIRRWQEGNSMLAVPTVTAHQGALLQNAINYIEKNYAEATESLAAQTLGVSTSYLSRIFKQGMKSSFVSYLTLVKLREGQRLLLTTEKSITEIALTTGFSTSSYFISAFRQRYRLTPSKYRRIFSGSQSSPGEY